MNTREQKSREFKEKRSAPRIRRRDIIQYSIENLPFGRVTSNVSQIRDLSEKGIFFINTFPIFTKAILKIKLRLPILQKSIELDGRIVACEQNKTGMLYGIRVEFMKITEEQKKALRNFIQLFIKQKENKGS